MNLNRAVAVVFTVALISNILVCMTLCEVITVKSQGFDLGWLRPGVRLWYAGIQAGKNQEGKTEVIHVETVYTITEADNQGVTVHVISSAQNFQMITQSYDSLVPDPLSEGPFWISPLRLINLKTGDVLVWGEEEVQVVIHKQMSYSELLQTMLIDDTPTIRALFLSSVGREPTAEDMINGETYGATRDIVIIQGKPENAQAVYTFAFDVETGLLLGIHSKDQYNQGTSFGIQYLAEINYDFLRKEAFPEGEGPHAGYSLQTFYYDMATGVGTSFNVIVAARYKDMIQYFMFGALNLNTPIVTDKVVIVNDLRARKVYAQLLKEDTGMYSFGLSRDQIYDLGTHTPFYIPKEDLNLNSITVWGTQLTRIGPGEFRASTVPNSFAFTYLKYDSEGFIQDWHTYIDVAGVETTMYSMTGLPIGFDSCRQFYDQNLGPVTPASNPLYQVIITETTTQTTTTTSPPPETSTTAPQPQTTTTSSTTQTTTQATTSTTPQTTQSSSSTSANTLTTAQEPAQAPGGFNITNIAIGAAIGVIIGVIAVVAIMRKQRTPYPPPPPPV